MMKKETMTLKDLIDFAKENGLPEDVGLFAFGKSRLLAITSISTEVSSEDALYKDIYFEIEEEPNSNETMRT